MFSMALERRLATITLVTTLGVLALVPIGQADGMLEMPVTEND
jgi:hypothetical protein